MEEELVEKYLSKDCSLNEEEISTLKNILIKKKIKELIKSTDNINFTQLEIYFHPVFNTLKTYQGVRDVRLYSCDALSIWLRRCVQIGKNELTESFKSRLKTLMNFTNCNFIFQYVLDFWNETGSPLSNALRELLKKTITFLFDFYEKNEVKNLLESWVLNVLKNIPFSKRVFYFALQELSPFIDCLIIFDNCSFFLNDSLKMMFSDAFANSVAKCLTAILQMIYKNSNDELFWLNLWKKPVRNALLDPALCRNTQLYLLPSLFNILTKPETVYSNFMKEFKTDSNDVLEISLYLGCLKIGIDLKINEEPFHEDSLINLQQLKYYLCHESLRIRINAYAILVSSHKKSKPIRSYIYPIVEETLQYYLVDDNADIRSDFHSLTRNFLLRIRDSTYATSKKLDILEKKKLDINNQQLRKEINDGKVFVQNIIKIIQLQISPGMTYQRLHLAFKLLFSLITSGIDQTIDSCYFDPDKRVDYPFQILIFQPTLIRLLIDNVTSNFDDIREMAVRLLIMIPNELKEFQNDDIFLKSMEILKHIQGKMSDSGSRLLQFVINYNKSQKNFDKNEYIVNYLILSLEENINAAKKNLTSSVSNNSVHGLYKGLSVVIENFDFELSSKEIENWNSRIEKIINLIHENWEFSKSILSNDSPEGNIPDEIDSEEVTSQAVSNYAWRGVKDSSLVLKSLLIRAPPSILSKESILKISELVLVQLASVNHKGAFHSIYPTFEECCNRCYLKDSGLESKPNEWLLDNLQLIKSKSTYIIRRSAGLPFLISLILVANNKKLGGKKAKDKDPLLFKITFEKLLDIAKEPISIEDYKLSDNVELPQVHAFNCIKQLFIEANLSETSSFYVDQGLELSFWGIQSEIWAIRNCAAMLFAALENKLFGPNRIGDTIVPYSARLFFDRFENLKEILINNFEKFLINEKNPNLFESIFPILTMISRLYPTNEINDLVIFKPYLKKSLSVKYFKVREMAARAISSSIFNHEYVSEIKELLIDVKKASNSYNELHGLLLAIKELLIKLIGDSQVSIDNELIQEILSLSDNLLFYNPVYIISKVYIDILQSIITKNELFSLMIKKIGIYLIELDECYYTLNGMEDLLAESMAKLILNYKEDYELFLEFGILSKFPSVQLVCLKYLSINQDISSNCLENIMNDLRKLLQDLKVSSYVKSAALNAFQNLSQKAETSNIANDLDLLFQFFDDDSSEDVKITALKSLGPLIGQLDNDDNDYVNKWVELLENYYHDNSIEDLRNACSVSIICMLKFSKKIDKVKAKCYFMLFNQLSDDSETIRWEITDYLSKTLKLSAKDPIFIINVFEAKYTELFKTLAIEILSESFMKLPVLQDTLNDFLKFKKVLFESEKDNLYKVDFIHYQSILKMMANGKEYLNSDQILKISNKVNNDWKDLINFINCQKNDGALGWSSNPLIFGAIESQLSNMRLINELNDNQSPLVEEYNNLIESKHIHPLLKY